jgi:hypothetical protein
MNSSEKIISDLYSKSIWNLEAENAFYDIWGNPQINFLPNVENMIFENKNSKFTEESLRLLGFYKAIFKEEDFPRIVKLLHKVILEPSYEEITKQQAIMQLGSFGEWPDMALRKILENESSRDLKVLAFRAILEQLRLPHQVVDLEGHLAATGEIEPDFDRINQVTQARADGHFDHLKT